MAAVFHLHPLIKLRGIVHNQGSDQSAEQERIQIEDENCLRRIAQFAQIHKAYHGHADGDNPKIAAAEIPAFFIKPTDSPKTNHHQQRPGPNADDAVIYAQFAGNFQGSADGYGTNSTGRIGHSVAAEGNGQYQGEKNAHFVNPFD